MLSVQDLHKSYQVGKTTYEVLKGVSLEVAKGEFVAVMGPSGSGKTTLLNCISCYIPADSGSIRLGSQELARLDEDTLTLHDHRVIAPIEGNMVPDGMTMDEEGMLWVCHWGGGFVGRYDPRDGRLLARVEIPASQCSSCCFGGPDMQTLFITCGAVNCPEESEAGKVFAVHLPYRGVESWKYRG